MRLPFNTVDLPKAPDYMWTKEPCLSVYIYLSTSIWVNIRIEIQYPHVCGLFFPVFCPPQYLLSIPLFSFTLTLLAFVRLNTGWGNLSSRFPITWAGLARFLPRDTISGVFMCRTWQMSRSSSHNVSFPLGKTPLGVGGRLCRENEQAQG